MPPLTLASPLASLLAAGLPDADHTIWSWALAILGIGFLIFVHELGHFLACRATKTRVETFSIGFGPRLFGWERHGGRKAFTVGPRRFPPEEGAMDVRVAGIPLGGYVKMAGEIGGDGTPGEGGERRQPRPDEFPGKPFLARVFIICAGVLMNALAAVVFYFVAYSSGVREVSPVIGDVTAGRPAWQAGMKPGDRVTSFDGTRTRSFDDLVQGIIFHSGGEPAEVVVSRGGESATLRLSPEYDEAQGRQMAAIWPPMTMTVSDGVSPPLAIGPEDRVTIDGFPAAGAWRAFHLLLAAMDAGLEEVLVEFPAGLPPRRISLARAQAPPGAKKTYAVGLVPVQPLVVDKTKDVATLVLGDRLVAAVVRAGEPPVPLWTRLDRGTVDGLVRLKAIESLKVAGAAPGDASGATRDVPVGAKTPAEVLAFLDRIAFRAPPADSGALVRPSGEAFPDGQSPAAEAGIKPGDRIVGVGSPARKVTAWKDLEEALKDLSDAPVTLTVKTGDETAREVKVTPKATFDPKPREEFFSRETALEVVRADGVGDAAGMALAQTGNEIRKVFAMIGGLFRGKISGSKAVSGPGTIVYLSSRKSLEGLAPFLAFLALISVNLAVLNLLPIPILDGGQLLFLFIERLRGGRPLKEATIARFQMVGLILLLALMFFAIKNDVINLGGK